MESIVDINETGHRIDSITNPPFLNTVSEHSNFNNTNAHNASSLEEQVLLWIIGIYFGNIALGLVFNSISLIALLRTKRNGTLSIILQMSATDLFTSWIVVLELLSLKKSSWPFASDLCPLFCGAEILVNTATMYLMIALNYHTISLCNLKMRASAKRASCDASNECLVRETGSGSAPALGNDISIVVPCCLVWFMSVSLSIPQFTLSSTSANDVTKTEACTFTDIHYGRLLMHLSVAFRVIIPIVFILLSLSSLALKLRETLRNDSIANVFRKKCHNVVYYLMFCLTLNALFIATSLPRLLMYAAHAFANKPQDNNAYQHFNGMPPLSNQFASTWLGLALSMLHYSGTFLRFLIYLFLLPKFKSIVNNNILVCLKRKDL